VLTWPIETGRIRILCGLEHGGCAYKGTDEPGPLPFGWNLFSADIWLTWLQRGWSDHRSSKRFEGASAGAQVVSGTAVNITIGAGPIR
jgi:hypothetical protein